MKQIIRRLFMVLPRLAWRLGGNNPLYQGVLYIRLVAAAIVWKLQGPRPIKFTFRFKQMIFSYRLIDSTDIAALEEIYIDHEYQWQLPFVPERILDLGANFGDTTLYYRALYPDAEIVAVEPNEASFKRLQAHTAHDPKIVPVRAALGATDSTQTLYIMADSNLGHSTIKRSDTMQAITVPGVTLETLLDTYTNGQGFDLIKFDIEGAEIYLLAHDALRRVSKAFVGELHFDLMKITKEEVQKRFAGFATTLQPLHSEQRYTMKAHSNSW